MHWLDIVFVCNVTSPFQWTAAQLSAHPKKVGSSLPWMVGGTDGAEVKLQVYCLSMPPLFLSEKAIWKSFADE